MAPLVDLSLVNIDEEKSFKLKWSDEAQARPLAEEGPDEEDLINLINPPKIMLHYENREIKSIAKGSKLN
jgi:hypothetical protein